MTILQQLAIWVVGLVMAADPAHGTAALGRTFSGPDFVHVRFLVTLPTEEIVAGLNEARPDVLVAYPSALHVLSFQARAGLLRIAPRQVLTAAEPLLPEIRAAAEAAWGCAPATSTAHRREAGWRFPAIVASLI